MKIYGADFEPITTSIDSVPCYRFLPPSVVYPISHLFSETGHKISSFVAELSLAYMLSERIRSSGVIDINDLYIDIRRKVYKRERLITDIDIFLHPKDDYLRDGIYFEVVSNNGGWLSVFHLTTNKSKNRVKKKKENYHPAKWSFLYNDSGHYDDKTLLVKEKTRNVFVVVFNNSKILRSKKELHKNNRNDLKTLNTYLGIEADRLAKRDISLGVIVIPFEWNGKKEWPFRMLSQDKINSFAALFNPSAQFFDFNDFYQIIRS